MYNEGISKPGDVLELGVSYGILEKSGAFIKYNGETLGQGREAVKKLFREKPELMEEIEAKVRTVAAVDQMVITNIKQGVKNPNRVNVFVDGKYAFSLDVAQVVDLKIKAGREISAEELARFKEASEYGKAYQRALEWVLVRPRSVGELRDYL